MPTLEFIAALYNEEKELEDLYVHVEPWVDAINFVDDGSTDGTFEILNRLWDLNTKVSFKTMAHTGLPETVKNEALKMVFAGAWVLMLDADERFGESVLPKIKAFLASDESLNVDYVYFDQIEIIDGYAVRNFQKSKLFRKEAIRFPLDNIHADDQFIGNGIHKPEWVVYHRKTSEKQKLRETEYLETYRRLREEGKIDEGREAWLRGLHHYVR